MTEKQAGEETVYLTCTFLPLSITEGSQDRNSNRQQPDAEATEGVAYRLVPVAGLACFLIEPRTSSPGVTPPTVGGASSINH